MISSRNNFFAGPWFQLIATLSLTHSIFALPSKTDILKKMEANRLSISVPYSASVATKVFVGNQAIKDSGTLFQQPPDCMQMQMNRANSLQSTCGDTTWIRSANGSITRSIGDAGPMGMTPGVPAFPTPKVSGSQKPDTNAMTIAVSALPNCVQVSWMDKEGKSILEIDTVKNLMVKASMEAEGGPPLETGFAYEAFAGGWIPKEIRSSLPGGFFTITYSNIKKEKKRAKKSFRLL
ncbi:MAG: hypothetical protein ABIW76_12260 [Fibrobacteria bacterium]